MPHYEDRPFRAAEAEPNQILKIALSVALGIAMAGLLGFAVRMYFVNQAIAQVNNSILQITLQSQRSLQMHQDQAAANQQAALEQASNQRVEAAARQKETQMLKDEAALEVARKEATWRRFYQKPPWCDTAEGQAFVECANGFIRATREFELKYAKGQV
ncbi:MAG: hypothetical protein JWO49_3041 [Arthrobacter sp.]|nr:hypothetical protein [Arthrobacter sp.]